MDRALLTIDWDFFVPEKLEWELFQEEKRLYLTVGWKRRFDLFDKMRLDGNEKDFWGKFNLDQTIPYYISDSHLAIYKTQELQEVDRVVIVDAHHDVFQIEDDGPDCGTWLAFWLKQDKNRKAYWVKPSHSVCIDPVGFGNQIVVVDRVDDLPKFNYLATHVCRSGCWTPPWTDAAFIRFALGFKLSYKLLGIDWTNPMKCRWSLNDYRQAFRLQNEDINYFNFLSKTPVSIDYIEEFRKQNYQFL